MTDNWSVHPYLSGCVVGIHCCVCALPGSHLFCDILLSFWNRESRRAWGGMSMSMSMMRMNRSISQAKNGWRYRARSGIILPANHAYSISVRDVRI